jgi:broad specificity phosphatase PhoE
VLRQWAPKRIFTSPLERAARTAEIIAERCGAEIVLMEEFREVDVGDLELRPPSRQAWALHDAVIRDWASGNAASAFPGGEDYLSLLRRFRSGLVRVCTEVAGCAGVVVGHGGLFGYTLGDICPGALRDGVPPKPLLNCSVTEIIARPGAPGSFRLIRWADDSHLKSTNDAPQPRKPHIADIAI